MHSKIETTARPHTSLWRRALRVVPVLFPLFILIGTGLRGLDFGLHWDEKAWQIGPVKTMVKTGILLPDYYSYPSFVYWVNTATLIPDIVGAQGQDGHLGGTLLRALDSYPYLMRLRAVYLIFTSLSVVWVYLLLLHWRRSWVEALLAASFLALSWEVAYHLRWVATDGMLMQFGALTLLFVGLSQLRPNGQKWLWCAAMAAGLGCGTKYPGGLLIVPVLLGAYFARDPGSPRCVQLSFLWKLALLFGVTYLVSTPATVLHPIAFIKGVLYEVKHYSTGHGGHTVGRGWEHAWRTFTYLASVLFSSFTPAAVLIFVLFGVGCYATIRESPKTALLILSFPVLYVLYFIVQATMVARNLLVLAPFMAVLAARGASFLWQKLSRKPHTDPSGGKLSHNPLQASFGALIVAALAANAGWLIYAAETIVDRNTDRFARKAAGYLAAKTDSRFFLSPRIRIHLSAIDSTHLPNATDNLSQADYIVLYASEGTKRWHDWPANRPRLTEAWFGPREVNFNIYPNWWGDDRILIISMPKAEEIGILIARNHPETGYVRTARRPAGPTSQSKDGTISWALPSMDPCGLVSKADAESIIGPLKQLARGWVMDGTACSYVGKLPVVVTLGVISTAAFELQLNDPGSTSIACVGDAAYTTRSNAFNDVQLFTRGGDVAIVVNVARLGDDPGSSRLEIAKAFAQHAMNRLAREPCAART